MLVTTIVENPFLTAKLLKPKFYHRHLELIENHHVSLKKLLQQGISNPEFYGDLVYKFKKIMVETMLYSLVARRWFRPQTQWRLHRESFSSWVKLDDCLWLDPPWFNLWFSLTLAYSVGIYSHKPSSLIHHSVLVDLNVSMMMH